MNRTVPLPEELVRRPVAHRGYHDRSAGRPENSIAALRAAMAAGYGVELDVQLSADGEAVVFHDYGLSRLTGEKGPLRGRTAAELGRIALLGGHDERIPTLAEFLEEAGTGTPVLIEIKDQDGAMGPDTGPLEEAVARVLRGRDVPVAVMSFNPHSMARMADLLPGVARGLTTSSWYVKGWPTIPSGVRRRLRAIPDYDAVSASFISHEAGDLGRERVARLKSEGASVLCWTIRSPEAEARARRIADNVTFEGYRA